MTETTLKITQSNTKLNIRLSMVLQPNAQLTSKQLVSSPP